MKKLKTEEYMRDMNFDDVDDIVWAHWQLVTSVIDSHAPLKQRCVNNRQIPCMNSTSTRGSCGAIGTSGISGIPPSENNMCIDETRW